MDFSERLMLIIAAFSIAILILGLILIPPQPASAQVENNTSEEPEIIEQPENSVWSLLNEKNVELQCLRQARAYAAEQGAPAFFVSSCSCSGNESDTVKKYDCLISAIDGARNVEAECVKSEGRCLFTYSGRTTAYTFEEMEKMMID